MQDPPKQLGPYQINQEIGRGGMGIVYLARDTRLDRPVAIKSLPEHLAQDPDRLARFEREARTLATLTHPNVAGIYGIEAHEGAKYLILEYVEGETLAERLDRGAIPVDEALELATQIAAGVEAAHEAGVIHRDLKPDNIKITPEGQVKVLDFGLAKSTETQSTTSTNLPTVTSPAILNSPTIPGAIMGTAPYMSPEQARGRTVDKRTDIWSFGVILYEMLTTNSPFRGETVSDSIGAILHKDADRTLLPQDTPRAIRHVLDRCLERDKAKRLRDIGDARIEIEHAAQASPSVDTDAQKGARKTSPLLLLLVAILFATIGAGAIMLTQHTPAPPATIRASILPPDDAIIVFLGDLAGHAVISRDGKRITYVAKQPGEQQQLYIRDLGAKEAEQVQGASGAMFPFWSRDGNQIAYFTTGDLRVYDILTRTNRTICPAPGGRGGAWLADGTIVFTPGFQAPIHRVSATGGVSTPITTVDPTRHTSHRWPHTTPDGTNFIYLAVSHELGKNDESTLYLATPPDQPDIEITRARFGAEIVDDQLLVIRNQTLTATKFNPATGELTGAAIPVIDDIATDVSTWNGPFSASATGAIVFHERDETASGVTARPGSAPTLGESQRTLLIARDGRVSNIIANGVPQNSLTLSPDSQYLAISGKPVDSSTTNSFDIWLYKPPLNLYGAKAASEATISGEASAETQARLSEPPRRLTFLEGTELAPQWSPDGQWVAFGYIAAPNTTTNKIYKVRLSGGSPVQILESPNGFNNAVMPTDWTADGRYIIYVKGSVVATGKNDLYAVDLETKESFPLVTNEGDQYGGQVSPDGKWLQYTSNESGISDIFVIPFLPGWEAEREQGEPTPTDNAKWRVSIAGGARARWSPTGDELFYISASNSMIAVPVRTDGVDFIHSAGSAIFQTKYDTSVNFDVTANGQGFAINAAAEETSTNISLLTNWTSLLNN